MYTYYNFFLHPHLCHNALVYSCLHVVHSPCLLWSWYCASSLLPHMLISPLVCAISFPLQDPKTIYRFCKLLWHRTHCVIYKLKKPLRLCLQWGMSDYIGWPIMSARYQHNYEKEKFFFFPTIMKTFKRNAWVSPKKYGCILEWKWIIVTYAQHTTAHNGMCSLPLTHHHSEQMRSTSVTTSVTTAPLYWYQILSV